MKINLEIIQSAYVYAPEQIEELKTKELVPDMMMRRRFTRTAKILVYLADQVSFSEGRVFYGSSFGELQSSANILNAAADNEPISPTDFQNSVYNTAPSYFSILKGIKTEILTVSSGDLTSLKLLQLAAVKGEKEEELLLAAVESFNIPKIEEVNRCLRFLETGIALKVKITDRPATLRADRPEIMDGFSASVQHMLSIAKNESADRIVEVSL